MGVPICPTTGWTGYHLAAAFSAVFFIDNRSARLKGEINGLEQVGSNKAVSAKDFRTHCAPLTIASFKRVISTSLSHIRSVA